MNERRFVWTWRKWAWRWHYVSPGETFEFRRFGPLSIFVWREVTDD